MGDNLQIKICGVNDLVSMNTAVNCNVDYIGLVFFEKSPRNVTIDLSKILLQKRSTNSKIVALTVNPDDDFLLSIKNEVNPDYFQLHGTESPERCQEIKSKFKIPIIKGIGIKDKLDLIKSVNKYDEICNILLLDAPSTNLPGGNGKKFNWEILKEFKSKSKWMLAGGINIDNIYGAIKIANPPAIDISSGLEVKQGIKTPELIKDFVTKCRSI